MMITVPLNLMEAEAAAKPTELHVGKAKRNPRKFAESLTVRELVKVLTYLDWRYEEKNDSPVSDEVHDLMVDVLKERAPKNKYLSKTGVEVKVKKGEKPSKDKVKLPVRMPSLDKLKPGSSKLRRWLEPAGAYCITDKLDGISLEIVYEKGVPVKAYTRGNGTIGKDRSVIIPHLRIPSKISDKKRLIVRAEVLMTVAKFMAKYHADAGGEYKDGRNMGGGLINRNDKHKALKEFRVVCFEILEGKGANTKQSSQLKSLKAMGFTVVKHKVIKNVTEQQLAEYHDKRRKTSSVQLDGIVVFRDKPYVRPTSGLPKYGMAFKQNSLENMKDVKVTEVEWRVTRFGRLHPRIHIEPVKLGNVTVKHFTGHNAYYILHGIKKEDRKSSFKSKPINIGATIRVVRSGDVIPYIVEVVKPSRKAAAPDVPFDIDGVQYVLKTADHEGHSEVQAKAIMQFFKALGIEGVQRGNVDKLIAAGYGDVKQIIRMEVKDFLTVDGFKMKTAQKLHTNLQQGLSDLTFSKLAQASNLFQGFGERRLDAIGIRYPDIMDKAWTSSELESAVLALPKFKTMAATFVPIFFKFKKWVRASKFKVKKTRIHVPKGAQMKGQTVGFSGVRDAKLTSWIQEQGGDVSNGVTRETTVLVMKETGTGSSKEQKAEAQGIKILTVSDFKQKYNL